ncbi:MAG: shikimate dehydrogenase [Alphaproteobacteria bacterium]|nr:shikimate dehydrogenase [Alphaproteobacteria bacterium]
MSSTFLSGKAVLAGVMGWPISHSKSPRLHGFWLREHAIDGTYVPLAVQPEKIEQALRALPVLGFRGCNLTIPHKELAMKIVDHIDPLAHRVGAVNTIIVRDDQTLEGLNTDVFGFSENLTRAGFSFDQQNSSATVLGAGGVARAIVVALQDMGLKDIRIVNRNIERAQALADSLRVEGGSFHVYGWEACNQALESAVLVVNSTSLGMVGQPTLEIDLSPLAKGAWVTDAVYAPLETDLLKQAQVKGYRTVDGLGMLLHQARPGFRAWFGVMPEITPQLRDHVLGTK